MSFNVLYVSATLSEAEALSKIGGITSVPGGYRYKGSEISVLVSGVGSVATAWAMKQWLSVNNKPDLAINGGIAGSYKDDIRIGDAVMPLTDCFADAGIEDGKNFLTLYEAGITGANEFPFREGLLITDKFYGDKMTGLLKPVKAISVNTVTGSEETKNKLLKKYNPDIESMEGATFFYICTREEIPFMAIRAISNRVEPRNKGNWNIEMALDKLSEKLNEVLEILY